MLHAVGERVADQDDVVSLLELQRGPLVGPHASAGRKRSGSEHQRSHK
jgi:hypothetical protein